MENTKSNIHIWLYSIMGTAILLLLFWGAAMQKNAKALEASVENQYNKSFHDLVSYIDNIDTLLTKAQLAGGTAQLADISADIFRLADEAKASLGTLPTSETELDNTAKFLSQVGDYTYVLSQNSINGTQISEEDYNNLKSLNEYAAILKEALSKTEQKIFSGEIQLVSAQGLATVALAADGGILEDLENVEKSFEEYPSLIYDGPFSEHIENRESEMLKNSERISRSEAKRRAELFLGADGRKLSFESLAKNTAIDCYTFTKSDKNNEISVSVTVNGGHILSYLNNRSNTGKENYSIDAASKIALAFLENRGYTNMVSSYYEKDNNVATLNYAYSDNGTICYSDLVKVRVSLDTGKVTGLEAKGYLMNHREREISQNIMDSDEARSHISQRLDVNCTGLCIIPKDSMNEVLCYEFHGTFNGKNFLIYVNAENGREEEIFLLIESENGTLTV